MIVFYTETKKQISIVPLHERFATSACDSACTANCMKPKNKCCNKYKKKGINCKRCPLTFDLKAVS